ncbi:MAG TPA: hypothetical protein VNV66_12200 [Pilimelia sp.]|nr:hypothetical protein [Pilimelia sp.]
MAFRWAAGALERLARAGIEPYEVMQVLGHGKRWPRQGHTPAGTVLTVWGRTRTGGRCWWCCGPRRGSLDSHITAARELDAAEVAELHGWEASR